MKRVKLLRINVTDMKDTNKTRILTDEEIEERYITLNDSYFLETYLRYFKEPYEVDMILDKIILVELLEDDEEATKQLKQGIELYNINYTYFISTVSYLKKEEEHILNDGTKISGKGYAIFIRENNKEFIDFYNNCITANKIKDKINTTLCINKYTARLGLGLSNAIKTNLRPRICIVPECKHIINHEYETIDLATNKIYKPDNKNIEVTQFDGCGVMSMQFADAIRKDLGLDYSISWCLIRQYGGLGVKGLITSIDFREYFKINYKADTSYFKNENDTYYIKDIYKNWVNINDVDLILNESQVKLWDSFKSMKEQGQAIKEDSIKEYEDLNTSLWIAKYNKDPKKIEKYNLINYQLLQVLSLTPEELAELSKETEQYYKRVLDLKDVDALKLWYKTFNKNKVEYDEEGEEIPTATIKVTEMCNCLIAAAEELKDTGFLRKRTKKMLKKKIKEMCFGRFYLENYYKTITQDPLSYLNWILNRNEKDIFIVNQNSLKEGEFYCSDIENGEHRTISRNPLATYSEVVKGQFVKNSYLNKWLGHLSKDLFVSNCLDLSKEKMSGCDQDGDICSVINNEIIYNNVIEDLPFISASEGNKNKTIYNRENEIKETIRSRGNLIGKLANLNQKINNECQEIFTCMYQDSEGNLHKEQDLRRELYKMAKSETDDNDKINKFIDYYLANYKKLTEDVYYSIKKNKFYTLEMARESYIKHCSKENIEFKEDNFKKALNLVFINIFTEPKRLMTHAYKHLYKQDSYRCRQYGMMAIDAPKTGIPVTKDMYKDLSKKYSKNSYFYRYKLDYEESKDQRFNWVNNAININARRINQELMIKKKDIEDIKDNKELILKYLSWEDVEDNEEYEQCKNDVLAIFDIYKDKNKYIYSHYDNLLSKVESDYDINLVVEQKKEAYKMRDLYMARLCSSLEDKYNYRLLSHVLSHNCTESFIFSNFFNTVKKILEETTANLTNHTYTDADDEESYDIEFMWHKYKKHVTNLNMNTGRVVDKLEAKEKKHKIKDLNNIRVRVKKYTKLENGVYQLNFNDKERSLESEFSLYKDSSKIADIYLDSSKDLETVNLKNYLYSFINVIVEKETEKSADILLNYKSKVS
ncbi:hypothetical protein KQH81_07905 [Clostridium cadaveris]|uniref:hypothetical protein n=1 Tax=Clostridium cadaveris TaxID=1529 RepID=UPI001E5958B4|nr:hypothetical protein [Clostridium cadaveris]UFH66434.1 hypothetical protein KQH81_07905 [Clostridium cadaveris]